MCRESWAVSWRAGLFEADSDIAMSRER